LFSPRAVHAGKPENFFFPPADINFWPVPATKGIFEKSMTDQDNECCSTFPLLLLNTQTLTLFYSAIYIAL